MEERPIRRRRRSTSSLNSDTAVANRQQVNELLSNIKTQQQSDFRPAPQTDSNLVDSPSNNDAKEAQSSASALQIDQIQAELDEEEYFNSGESEYSDESHSWSEQLPESDDYWHFVGLYE